MGAWIETYTNNHVEQQDDVAPYMGAWIETRKNNAEATTAEMSHPIWVRGLKQLIKKTQNGFSMSHPTWVRGLKLPRRYFYISFVESHPTWVRGLKLYIDASLTTL